MIAANIPRMVKSRSKRHAVQYKHPQQQLLLLFFGSFEGVKGVVGGYGEEYSTGSPCSDCKAPLGTNGAEGFCAASGS